MFAMGSGGIVLSLELDSADQSFQTVSNSSTTYQITDCRLLADTYSVDSSLMKAYSLHLLSGKPLMLGPFKSHCVTSIASSGERADISVAMSFARVCSVIATLHGPNDSTRAQTLKSCNDFYIP